MEDVRLIPVRINDDCQPVPLSGEAATRLERRLAALSAALTRPEAASTARGRRPTMRRPPTARTAGSAPGPTGTF